MCNAGNCHLNCDGQNCKQNYNTEQGNCSLTCNGGNCTQICNKGTCDLKCYRHCMQTCNGGVCGLECKECQQKCFCGDCNLECLGGRCLQRCSQLNVRRSCQVHCPVAGLASKCQQNCQNKVSQCTKYFITITEAPTWTGKRSNESATVLTDPALKRGRGKKKTSSFIVPFHFCSTPFLISQILVLI